MLARLSVFAAPFTVAAAEAVGGQDGAAAVQDLSTLLDYSMVSAAGRSDGQRGSGCSIRSAAPPPRS
jgi:hypothetical protein